MAHKDSQSFIFIQRNSTSELPFMLSVSLLIRMTDPSVDSAALPAICIDLHSSCAERATLAQECRAFAALRR